jgi:hypothetical protein
VSGRQPTMIASSQMIACVVPTRNFYNCSRTDDTMEARLHANLTRVLVIITHLSLMCGGSGGAREINSTEVEK